MAVDTGQPNAVHIDDTALLLGGAAALAAIFLFTNSNKPKPSTPVNTGVGGLTPGIGLPISGTHSPACPAGQVLNGNTGQCIVPIAGGCPVNYTPDNNGNCVQNTSLASPSGAQLCAQIGYTFNGSACVAPPGAGGELLAPANQGYPAQYLPSQVPVPAICQTGFFWDQQAYPGQPALGCIVNPYNTGPIGLCPVGTNPQTSPANSCA